MNKFQEALDKVKKMLYDRYINDFGNEINVYPNEITILQELIDNYEKLEQKNIELKTERDKTQIIFEKATSKLLKAFDKACETIFFAQIYKGMTPRNIKEYYLKESERQ